MQNEKEMDRQFLYALKSTNAGTWVERIETTLDYRCIHLEKLYFTHQKPIICFLYVPGGILVLRNFKIAVCTLQTGSQDSLLKKGATQLTNKQRA